MPRAAKAAKPPETVSGYTVAIVPLEDLRPYNRNARTHSPEQIEAIAASIREFGWTNPVLAEINGSGLIAAGHGRRLAALKLYEAGEVIRLPDGRELPAGTVPAIDCAGWSDAQRRAYVLADNQLALGAAWDEGLLKLELGELKEEDGFDLSVIGFSSEALEKMFTVVVPPGQFPSFGEGIETEHECPRCHYKWSGKSS